MVYDWFQRQSAESETPASKGEVEGSESSSDGASAPASAEVVPETSPDPDPEPSPAVSSEVSVASAEEDPLEWARQAYARLKAQQSAQSAEPPQVDLQEPSPSPSSAPQAVDSSVSLPSEPSVGLSLLEQAAAQREERRQQLDARATEVSASPVSSVSSTPTPSSPTTELADEPQLGDFDDSFTWSAEVLAAQGRRVDQVSLEEIDWLSRLRQGLEKTRQGFVTGLLDNLGDDPLTPEVVDDLEAMLLRADAGVLATDQVMEALRKRLNEEVVDPSEGIRFLKEQLRHLLEQPIASSGVELLAPERGRLNIWLMVGVNGVGKTTTLGKLANLAVRSGYSAMIAAADTFRAAAVQQVEVWGERSDVPVVANPTANADPAAVVFDAIGAARSKGTDLLLVDTAGRLQTKHNLMEELQKIRRIVDRLAPESKVESLLVLDASQGQNGLKQAMAFAKAANLTGVVITKLDGTARGGVALAVSSEAGLPIRFIGAGEGIRDLRPFNSFEFVEALL
ncbi:MAG: signal recognition particle-docking protein FtsY, partial [Synechococcus sp.]|nr:signal recognition particle-docking protein FtsY [Synechococcus sp.]